MSDLVVSSSSLSPDTTEQGISTKDEPISSTENTNTTTNEHETSKETSKKHSQINSTIPQEITASESTEQSSITLTLLLATGLRVHLKLDDGYISQHNLKAVESASLLKVSELKQCLFTSWKTEWGAPPNEPTNIRLIFYGKILDDDQTLDNCKLATGGAQNIVHMSVRPASFEMDDPSKSKGKNSRGGDQGSRCCVIC